jgi:hypothetical protein
MNPSFNERLIAYLTLFSGLAISLVAVYYSVIGLTAIFAAAVLPIIIMGVTLELSKLVATVWLKQNWSIAPTFIKIYLILAILVLMAITSMGIFGFLSKAHLDQTVPSGEIVEKIALIDERIKVEKDSIEANRKNLRQLDDAVDQIMARSSDERGAARANTIRRNQQRDRDRLNADIDRSQKSIAALNEERLPLSNKIRTIEAEVGPIKYIASFVYGSSDQAILEKSVTWVIIILIVVFDPLAVILLLASQVNFQHFRERKIQSQPKIDPPVVKPSTGYSEKVEPDPNFRFPFESKVFQSEPYPDLKKTPINNQPQEFQTEPIYPSVETAVETGQSELSVADATATEIKTDSTFEISQEDYLSISQEKLEKEIEKWVSLIRENKADMSMVPQSIMLEVRARI